LGWEGEKTTLNAQVGSCHVYMYVSFPSHQVRGVGVQI
jgi:hypothetical protein